MNVINLPVIDRLRGGKTLWVGAFPPRGDMFDGRILLDPDSDFRLPHVCHQAFDLVCLVEPDLGRFKQWPLLLDEALRAVRPGGVLVVRLVQSAFLSIFKLANFLEKWTHGQYQLLDQVQEDGRYILTVQLTHPQARSVSSTDFAFGLVTDGRKPRLVESFVRSIRALNGPAAGAQAEILICGPDEVLSDLGELAENVRLVPQPDRFDQFGWITRKKNLLVDAATAENIVVAHDRYSIPVDFLDQIAKFGGDFGVIVARQITTGGEPVPDWVMISEHLNWSTPGWMEFGDYHPYAFVNGGVIVAKTALLKEVRWSELLMWGQAEDVEFSRRLSDAGVTPRPGRNVVLYTEAPRAGFSQGYEKLPWDSGLYPMTDRPTWDGATPSGPSALALSPAPRLSPESGVDLKGKEVWEVARETGVIFGRSWIASPRGLVWTGKGRPEFSLKSRDIVGDLLIGLDLDENSVGISTVSANAQLAHLYASEGSRSVMLVPRGAILASNILHLALTPAGQGALVLRGIDISRDMAKRQLKKATFGEGQAGLALLGRGWGAPGARDVFAVEPVAFLVLSLSGDDIRSLRVSLEFRRRKPGPASDPIVVRVGECVVAQVTPRCDDRLKVATFDIALAPGEQTLLLGLHIPDGLSIALAGLTIREGRT